MDASNSIGAGLGGPAWFDAVLRSVALAIEAAGVAVIVIGAAVALVMALREVARGGPRAEAYGAFRINLARSILLGLELLVAADIIGTVAVDATLENIYVLGLIILIRTFLSISLEVEIDGRWPWQKSQPRSGPPSI